MTSQSDKIKLASQFILDGAPGEFHEVLNDIRVLINDDQQLQAGAKQAIHDYNTSQFIVCAVKEQPDLKVMVTRHAQLEDQRTFQAPHLKKKFTFDHVLQVASHLEDYTAPEHGHEQLRLAVEKEVELYVKNHYPNGFSAVYSVDQNDIVICIASNKFNSSNFWNGRWLSEWRLNIESLQLSGNMRACVHYYEDGNVQLNTAHTHSSTLTETDKNASDKLATSLKKVIGEAESKYQTALNESYAHLSETVFKGLRKALPVTKSKVDWNKILNYKIGPGISR